MKKFLFVIILLACSFSAYSQVDTTMVLGGGEKKEIEQKRDTLNTYIFGDWHKTTPFFSWKQNPYFNTIERVAINDTLPNDVRVEYPVFKRDVGAVFLGTAGGATITQDFFQRADDEYFYFYQPYQIYDFSPDNIPYYNVKRPFTVLSYQQAGGKIFEENDIRILHTQNITPEWNAGILYQRYGTKGWYHNQDSDSKSFSFFTSYTGRRYAAHAAYIFNNITNEENGGIRNDYDIQDTVQSSEDIDVNLLNARNRFRKHTLYFSQSLGIPLTFLNKKDKTAKLGDGTLAYIGHSLEYTSYTRRYTDKLNTGEDYYKHWYLNPSSSYDSTATSYFDAKAFARLQPWAQDAIISTIGGGIGYQSQKYYGFEPNQYLNGKKTSSENSMYFYANASGQFSKYFAWEGFTRYFLTGRTNFLLDAKVKFAVYPRIFPNGVHLNGRFFMQYYEPNFFAQNYYSNHIKWNNNFDKITRTQIEGELLIPDWDLTIGIKQALVKNYMYSDTAALPQQYNDNLSVTSLYVKKNFTFGLLHLDNQALIQFSGNEDVLPLPKWSANLTWYLQATLVKSVLVGQFGVDCHINSRYYVYAYNPAAGMFHLQTEKDVGLFPYLEGFMNLKWKRTTIFVKLSNFLKDTCSSEYFGALHYPRNNNYAVRVGITWHFFN